MACNVHSGKRRSDMCEAVDFSLVHQFDLSLNDKKLKGIM